MKATQLQPEPDLMGQYGTGWKGVWKWCRDHADLRKQIMKEVKPELDFLVIQMDGDVSRKEKSAHCWCPSVSCPYKGVRNPLECDIQPQDRDACPVILPCQSYEVSIASYEAHLTSLISTWLGDLDDTCIAIPCDSTEAWIVAAYDRAENVEYMENPWETIIAKKKTYHGIRISGKKKKTRIFEEFAGVVFANWEEVTKLCQSARDFEKNIEKFLY